MAITFIYSLKTIFPSSEDHHCFQNWNHRQIYLSHYFLQTTLIYFGKTCEANNCIKNEKRWSRLKFLRQPIFNSSPRSTTLLGAGILISAFQIRLQNFTKRSTIIYSYLYLEVLHNLW